MAFKFVILSCLVAAATAGLLPAPVAYSNPIGYSSHELQAPIAYTSHAVQAPIAYTSHAVQAPVAYTSHAVQAPVAYTSHAVQAPVAYTSHAIHATPISYSAPKYAAPITYAAPIAKEAYEVKPQYSYSYDVQDGHTGDSKTHHESRDGDVVHGSYSLVDPDGTKRTVEYTADPHNGFIAVVHREPLGHVVKSPVVAAAPIAYAAPVYHH